MYIADYRVSQSSIQTKIKGGGKGVRMGNTCKSMADSCHCMTKTTTILQSNQPPTNKNKWEKKNQGPEQPKSEQPQALQVTGPTSEPEEKEMYI